MADTKISQLTLKTGNMVASDLVEITEGGNTTKSVTGTKILGFVSASITGITTSQANAITANTAKVTNATHSGEVTGATALTIADNIVDEANLKVSNTPTNGYALTAQSGNTGGLTWAAVSGGGENLAQTLALGNSSGSTNLVMTSGQKITTNTIDETTSASGVTIDSVLVKDSTVKAGTLTIGAGSITDSSGAITFGNENLTTTGTLGVSGGSSNGVQISQGAIAIKNGGTKSSVDFYCEVSNAHYARLQAPAHSAFSGNVTITLPTATGNLVGTGDTGVVATGMIADDAVTPAKLANSINSEITANTAKTGITSAQSSAITANTSKVTNATHSGEVTGSGALTIANAVVDEANLKVSNNPTNGYVLTAQSGNAGGLTWAEAAAGGYASSTSAPSSPANGDRWFESTNGILYIYLDSNWVDISTAAAGGGGGGGGSMTHVSTATVSGTSTAEVIVAVDNTYKTYKIYASWEVRSNSNSSIEQRFTDGGTAVTDNAAYTGARQYNGAGSAVNGNGKMVTGYPDSNLAISSQEWTIFMDGNNIKKVLFNYGITRDGQGSSVVAQGAFSPHEYSASGNIDGISWKSPNTQFKAGSTFILYGLAE